MHLEVHTSLRGLQEIEVKPGALVFKRDFPEF